MVHPVVSENVFDVSLHHQYNCLVFHDSFEKTSCKIGDDHCQRVQ